QRQRHADKGGQGGGQQRQQNRVQGNFRGAAAQVNIGFEAKQQQHDDWRQGCRCHQQGGRVRQRQAVHSTPVSRSSRSVPCKSVSWVRSISGGWIGVGSPAGGSTLATIGISKASRIR